MKIKYNVSFYTISFLILLLLTLKISPLSDDWYYATSPKITPDFTQLLPAQNFWRPFDVLFGFLLGKFPYLFPYLNRGCVILSHILSVFFLSKILHFLNMKKHAVNFCVLYAMFSSSTIATVISPDGLNQAFSLLFGLIGLYMYIKKPANLSYVFFCALSVFWKESGIIWIFVVPFLDISLSTKKIKDLFTNKDIRVRWIKAGLIALTFTAVYFGSRFALLGEISLGADNSRYSISLFSFSTIKNCINIFANALTGIDSISLFTVSPISTGFIITSVLSSIFLCYIVYLLINVVIKKDNIIGALSVITTAIIVSLPHIVMESAGEMHSYPTVFAVCITYAYLISKASNMNKNLLIASSICIFLAFGISGTHKLNAVYNYSDRTQNLTRQMQANYDNPEDRLLIISVNEQKGYSVFTQPAIVGSYYGKSLKPYFDWRELPIKHINVKNEKDAEKLAKQNFPNYNKIWTIINDKLYVDK